MVHPVPEKESRVASKASEGGGRKDGMVPPLRGPSVLPSVVRTVRSTNGLSRSLEPPADRDRPTEQLPIVWQPPAAAAVAGQSWP